MQRYAAMSNVVDYSIRYPIRRLHQIEITSRCNLRCKYCLHPSMERAKIDMDEATYIRCLEHARWFKKFRGQTELNICGVGESTMHPEFVRYMALAREYVGDDVYLTLATNGLLITDELAKEMAKYNLRVWLSLHRPEKAGPALEILKKYKIIEGCSADPAVAAIDWAGQMDWHVSAPQGYCAWMQHGRVFVLSDGRVSRCCLDAHAIGVFAHVDDDLTHTSMNAYKLCETCNWTLPQEEFAHATNAMRS